MIGPVFTLECQQAKRRAGRWPWRWGYIAVLLLEAAVMTYEYAARSWGVRNPIELYAAIEVLFVWLQYQQIAVILFVAPAFAAGSITEEKRLGTLDFLLGSPLGSVEIIVGKWLAQATLTLRLLSPSLFLLVAIIGLLGHPVERFCAAVVVPMALIYALTAFALFASTSSRTTTRAILVVYAMLAAIGVAEWLSNRPILWLPIGAAVWNHADGMASPVQTLGVLGLATLLSLAMAAWRLRPAHEMQQTVATAALGRWWDRPPIADTPMRWKERFIGDWLALPIWTLLPRGIRYAVFMSGIVAIGLAMPALSTFLVLGSLQFLLTGIFVAIRCAGSITGERENQTWDSLVLTRMDARQLLRGKLWGQIDAARPYLLAYLVACLPVACLTDGNAVLWILYTWLASWVFLYYLGTVGISCSCRASSTWRSIAVTLTKGIGTVLASQATLGVSTLSCGALLVFMVLPSGPGVSPLAIALSMLVPVPGLLWLLALTEESMHQAEMTMIQNDRANRAEKG